jgi:hypothetical protein
MEQESIWNFHTHADFVDLFHFFNINPISAQYPYYVRRIFSPIPLLGK